MSRGRKHQPQSQAEILDFPGKRSKSGKNTPKVDPQIPNAPSFLSKRGTEIFGLLCGRLSAQKLASASHTEMLALLASRIEEVELLHDVLQKEGRTYQTTSTAGDIVYKARPEVAMKNEAMRHAQSLLSEFGLSPSAVNKVSAKDGDQEDNPLAGFLS